MSANSRLTVSVHILTWMARFQDIYEFATSERIAQSINTNPVILRGLLKLMEKQHLVRVQRGSNAGWQLARSPEEITLLDVYRAIKPEALFALHHTPPNPDCRVGCGIGPVLADIYANAQDALGQELAHTTIADVLRKTLAVAAPFERKAKTEPSVTAPPPQTSPYSSPDW